MVGVFLLIQVQVEGKARLRRQIGCSFFRTVVYEVDVRIFQKSRKSPVIELLQMVHPYLETEVSGSVGDNQKRFQCTPLFCADTGKSLSVKNVLMCTAVDKDRYKSGNRNAQEGSSCIRKPVGDQRKMDVHMTDPDQLVADTVGLIHQFTLTAKIHVVKIIQLAILKR